MKSVKFVSVLALTLVMFGMVGTLPFEFLASTNNGLDNIVNEKAINNIDELETGDVNLSLEEVKFEEDSDAIKNEVAKFNDNVTSSYVNENKVNQKAGLTVITMEEKEKVTKKVTSPKKVNVESKEEDDSTAIESFENDDKMKTDENSQSDQGDLYSQQDENTKGSAEGDVPRNEEADSEEAIEEEIISENIISNFNVSINNKKVISTGNQRSTNGNKLQIKNKRIIEADNAIVSTIGGYEATKFMYPTLNDAINKTNGITVSGGGFTGAYFGTENSNGKYYFKINISGFEGYISSDDAQLIPKEMVKAQSYYTSINGEWVFKEAIDPLKSTDYEEVILGIAPDWAEAGVKYYSNDNENYTTDTLTRTAMNKVDYSYFQNLPFRSTANYTAAQYKQYLGSVGSIDSKYYGSTQSFIDGQKNEGVNSLILFAMANHESAYGKSKYAKKCYNFFGRGAYDSKPDNACIEYGFNTARDGILAQTYFLTQGYADVDDWRWYGTEPGNKKHGMNVKYASDPDWGLKLARHAYNIDKFLGSKETNKYAIYEVIKGEVFRSDSTLKTKLKKKPQNKAETDYYLNRQNYTKPRVVVTAEDAKNKSLKVQIPMAKNLKASGYLTWSEGKKGKYPNYDKVYGAKGTSLANYVNKNTANFVAKYNDFNEQQAWYPKGSLNFVAGSKNPKKVETKTTTCKTGGKIQTEEILTTDRSSNKLLDRIYNKYDCNTGKSLDYTHEMYDLNTKRTYYRHIINNGKVTTFDRKITYHGNTAIKNQDLTITYNSKGKQIDYKNDMYNSNGKKNYYRRLINNTDNGVLTYDRQITYHGKSGVVNKDQWSKFYKTKVRYDYQNEMNASNGKRIYYRHIMNNAKGVETFNRMIQYYGSTGIKKDDLYARHNDKKIRTDYQHEMRLSNNKRNYFRKIELTETGKHKRDIMELYDNKGRRTGGYSR